MEWNGKAIGIGASTQSLSFAHCVEDALQKRFPVKTYREQLFEARCINYNGDEEIVKTYAHDMLRMNHKTPRYMKRYVSTDVCEDLTIRGVKYFRADTKRLLPRMIELANMGITIYPRLLPSRLFGRYT
jgi:hypothetical protein